VAGTIRDAMSRSNDGDRTATAEAGDWLADYLASRGGEASSADMKKAGAGAGHTYDCLKRAKRRLGVTDRGEGFPRRTLWELPSSAVDATVGAPVGAQSEQDFRGDALTALTECVSAPTVQVRAQSEQSEQSERPGRTGAPTAAPTVRSPAVNRPPVPKPESRRPPEVCEVCPDCQRWTAVRNLTGVRRHLRDLSPDQEAGHPMSTTTTTADDRACPGCGAQAGSCGVRRWLSGRPCCESCDHVRDHVRDHVQEDG